MSQFMNETWNATTSRLWKVTHKWLYGTVASRSSNQTKSQVSEVKTSLQTIQFTPIVNVHMIYASTQLNMAHSHDTDYADMSDGYTPQINVDFNCLFTVQNVEKRSECIINSPLASQSDVVQISHIYICAGAYAKILMQWSSDTPGVLLDRFAPCLTHSTLFREARGAYCSLQQASEENVTLYFPHSQIFHLFLFGGIQGYI